VDGTRTRKNPEEPSASSASVARDGANGRESTQLASVSRSLVHTVEELEAALASITRALGSASGDAVVVLAGERAALRAELRGLRECKAKNIVALRRRPA
jgi:hypothetical protein